MHRDQRVGLALGVLLLGAVGAFFFRNEARSAPALPQLSNAVEIDQEISEKAYRPYAAPARRLETQPVGQPLSGQGGPLIPDWNSDDDSPRSSVPSNRREDLPTLSTIDDGEDWNREDVVPSVAPIEVPALAPSRPTNEKTADTAAPGAGAERLHVVERGDTLSSISARYLGRESRFLEIFEANRDQLRDANGLKPGMKLRIPTAAESQDVAAGRKERARSQSDDTPSRSSNSPTPARTKMFGPARRQSFVPGGGDQTSQEDPACWGGKRLGQMPPDADPAVIR